MKKITAQELMNFTKLATIRKSEEYGETPIPTMICFVLYEDGCIDIYTTALDYLSFNDLEGYIRYYGNFSEYMMPLACLNKDRGYDTASFDAHSLLKDLENVIKEWSYPHAKYFKNGGEHYFWAGYHIDYPLNTVEHS